MNRDMSPKAITARLRLVTQITRACLSLKNAEFQTKKAKTTAPHDRVPYSSEQTDRTSSP